MANKSKRYSLNHSAYLKRIGTTVAEERFRNTSDGFWFALERDVIVNPFDFVTVSNARGTITVGMVKQLEAAPGGFRSESASNGRVGFANPQESVILASVAPTGNSGYEGEFARNVPVEMPVGAGRPVRFSSEQEVLFALGTPDMKNPIPVGAIEMANGLSIPISFDVSFLLGPDTTHVNAAGISGNNKTTYLLFLLQAAYQRLEETAVIIFNTKEQDLLHNDDGGRVKTKDKLAFSMVGIDLEPFDHVTYMLPRGPDGRPNSAYLPKNSKTYSFELGDVYESLDLLFLGNQSSPFHTPQLMSLASILNYIYESWPLEAQVSGGPPKKVRTWSDLSEFRGYPQEIAAHQFTLLRFFENLRRIRKSSLFVDRKKTSTYLGDEIRRIRNKQVYVIDIARIPSLDEQAFIVGDVMKCIDEIYSLKRAEGPDGREKQGRKSRMRKTNAPKYVLIFIDEINRFVPRLPSGVKMASAAEQIMKTVMTGGSRGTVLFSAQQFKSAVHQGILENTGLHVCAKLGLQELESSPAYSGLDEHMKLCVTRLNRGEMVLLRPALRQPVRIVFPRTPLKL